MRFLNKVVAKILSDKERVKEQQKRQRSQQHEDSFHKDEHADDTKRKSAKIKVPEKAGKILVPDAFKAKIKKLTKKLNDEHVDNLMNSGEWINKKALESLLSKYDDSTVKADQDFASMIRLLIDKEHDEPYTGSGGSGTLWNSKDKSFAENKLQHAVPRQVKDLKGTLGKNVPSGGVDPFHWLDSTYQVTKKLLTSHKDKPLTINTRSDLIAHDDYLKEIDPKKHKIRIHILTEDERLGRILNPGSASYKRLLAAAKKLDAAGIKVTLVIDSLKHKDLPEILEKLSWVALKAVKKDIAGTKIETATNNVKLTDEAYAKIVKVLGVDLPHRSAS